MTNLRTKNDLPTTAAPPASEVTGRRRRARRGSGRRLVLLVGLVALETTSLAGAPVAAALATDGATATTAPTPAPGAATTAPPPPVTITGPVDQTLQPPLPPTPDTSAHLRVLLTRLAVIDAREQLADRRAAAAQGQADQVQAQAALDDAVRARTDAEHRLRRARRRLDSSAVYAYMHAPGSDLPAALEGDSTAGGRERELLSASIDQHTQQVAEARDAVMRARARVDSAQRDLDRARRAAAERDGQVASALRALDDARDHLRVASADELAPLPTASWQLSIEGPSEFTAGELAEWYEQQGHGSLASVPVAALARAFIEQGNAEGIRGDMAFAQSIHETGWFSNTDTVLANNFAGIGHCSACGGGVHFADAEVGVLAQIQLLKSYAESDPMYNNPRAAPDLDGPSGCCPNWTDLGGVWASDPGYGPRILGYYVDMLEWLVAERSAGL